MLDLGEMRKIIQSQVVDSLPDTPIVFDTLEKTSAVVDAQNNDLIWGRFSFPGTSDRPISIGRDGYNRLRCLGILQLFSVNKQGINDLLTLGSAVVNGFHAAVLDNIVVISVSPQEPFVIEETINYNINISFDYTFSKGL